MTGPAADLYIREAGDSDLHEIASLERQAFPVPWKQSYFAAEVAQPFRYNRVVREAHGPLAGYLFCAFAGGEIHVHKIAVSERWRRKGVARLLMADLFAFADRIRAEVIYLEVRPSNGPARELYRTLGFREVGRRPRYYLDGEDALVLSVDVPPGAQLDCLHSKRGDSASATEPNTNQEVSMASLTEELKRDLSVSNEEFQKLLRHHHEHERRLAELASKSFLSSDEEIEEKKLKKEKLHLKDRMEEIAREYKARVGSPH